MLPASSRALVAAPTLPPLFDWLREQGGVAAAEMARTFNCGTGMVLVVDRAEAEAVIAALNEAGEQASVIGEIIAGQRGCEIHGAPGQWGETAAWTASHDA